MREGEREGERDGGRELNEKLEVAKFYNVQLLIEELFEKMLLQLLQQNI